MKDTVDGAAAGDGLAIKVIEEKVNAVFSTDKAR